MFFDFLKRPDNFFSGIINKVKPTRAAIVAIEDEQDAAICNGRRFSLGSRPVIRWIKGDGLDDMVTRAAIGQATRLFGSDVDYCLCTQGIDATRTRYILEWATQPVEWWPVSEEDNPQLAMLLKQAGCEPENFGYWWKWFPERIRPEAPEWILDGDMVITGKPDWYQKWLEGNDVVRLSQDDAEDSHIYGKYSPLVNLDLMLYSGLVSLPPKCTFMPLIIQIMTIQPLLKGHNGKKDMCEQGIIAAAFQKLDAVPIPLYEFPFCRAFQDYIDFGLIGDQGKVWGYHFGNSFVMENPHFNRLTADNIVFSKTETSLIEKFQWLGGQEQWGTPGWSMTDGCAGIILELATDFKGKFVLELGTSRGRLSAMLAKMGCKVTTIDHFDRGAEKNLQNLNVITVVDDAINFLETSSQYFDLIICDLHGNSPANWKHYSKQLIKRARSGSTLIISNAFLYKIPEWKEETGVKWFLKQLPKNWHIKLFSHIMPGVAFVSPKNKIENGYTMKSFLHKYTLISFLKFQTKNLKGIKRFWLLFTVFKKIRIIKKSGLFDKKFYLQNNPDVKLSGMSAIKHYLLYGGFEGRNPSAKFDSGFYLAENNDIKENGMNPLVHFIKYGNTERRAVQLGSSYVATKVPKGFNFKKSEIVKSGKMIIERVSGLSDLKLLRSSEYFDTSYYLRLNPDVKAVGIDPVEHYFYHGWKEGRNPSPLFDTNYYLDTYSDISENKMNPLLHYLLYGKQENRLAKRFKIDEEVCQSKADINKIDNNSQIPNGIKLAVVCHLFYLDLSSELFSYFKNIPLTYDLFLTTTSNQAQDLFHITQKEIPEIKVKIISVPNKGRDIAPFIKVLKSELMVYNLVCKVHSKKSNHDKNLNGWRNYLLDNLLGSKSIIETIIEVFNKDPKLGMVWPLAHPYLSHLKLDNCWDHQSSIQNNKILAIKIFPELELENTSGTFDFPNGSMFWFRPEALNFIIEKNIEDYPFEEEEQQVDGTLAHVFERLFGILNYKAGFHYKTTFFNQALIHKGLFRDKIYKEGAKSVLFIAHDLCRAGAEMVLLHILSWLNLHTYHNLYVLALKKGFDGGKLLSNYIRVSKVFLWEDLLDGRSEIEAMEYLKSQTGKIDLIYGNTIVSANIYPLLKVFQAPYITHIHELEESIQRYTTAEVREKMKEFTKRYISCSQPVQENLEHNHNIDNEILRRVDEFIHTDVEIPNDKNLIRRNLELATDRVIIWGCGTIYWRKGPDLFIETAIKLKNKGIDNFLFCWIGRNQWNNEVEEWEKWEKWEKLIHKNELINYISFLGEKEYPKEYFRSGDIYYLPSREDPFPLVCLEAAECMLPVVCFEDAGGMPAFVENDAGIVIPYLNLDAAADALEMLIKNESARKALGENARTKLLQLHTDDIAVPEILKICIEVMQTNPLVSIIVPVYNHEKFLIQRIESILNQTFRDFEVIILDDCSDDRSIEIAQSYLWHPAVSVITNDSNNGSPFQQWQKGIELAKGEIIWIAEGDDYCDSDFLQKLLPFFNDESVALAYCNSWIIDGTSSFIGNYDSYLHSLDPIHWKSAYQVTAQQEINFGLGVKNSIPNASAVLFRKNSISEKIFSETINYQFSGDWYFYTQIIKGNEIAFCPERLNYHRKHNQTVTSSFNSQKSNLLLKETALIHENILENYSLSKLFLNKWEFYIAEQIHAFYPLASTPDFDKYYPFSIIKEKITIKLNKVKQSKRLVFITTNDGSANGGSEQLWKHSAIACCKRGHSVMVVIKKWNPEPLFIKEFYNAGITVKFKENEFFNHIINFNPDLIIISIGDQDEGIDHYKNCRFNNIPYVIVNQLTKEPEYWPIRKDISEQVKKGYLGAKMALFTGENNLRVMEKRLACSIPNAGIFYNPFDVDRNTKIQFPSMKKGLQIAIPANLVVIHKGQHLAIELFNHRKWRNRQIHLNIYGMGSDENVLKKMVNDNKMTNVTFHGHSNNILEVWKENHAIFLPSFMEGLPLVLVGAMICGRVPIVTDIGAHSEVIDDNISGFIAAQPTIEALDEAFERAFQKSATWEEIGNEARRKILSILPIDPIEDFISKILPHAKSNVELD